MREATRTVTLVLLAACRPAPPAPPPAQPTAQVEAAAEPEGPPPDTGDPKRPFFHETPALLELVRREGVSSRSESWELVMGIATHCYSIDVADPEGVTTGAFLSALRQEGFSIDSAMLTAEKPGASGIALVRTGSATLSVCHDYDVDPPDAFDPFLEASPPLREVRAFVEANPVRLETCSLDWRDGKGISAYATGTFDGSRQAALLGWLQEHGYAVQKEDGGLRRSEGPLGKGGRARIGVRRDDFDLEVAPLRAALPWAE